MPCGTVWPEQNRSQRFPHGWFVGGEAEGLPPIGFAERHTVLRGVHERQTTAYTNALTPATLRAARQHDGALNVLRPH
jgi:hypothetical protein